MTRGCGQLSISGQAIGTISYLLLADIDFELVRAALVKGKRPWAALGRSLRQARLEFGHNARHSGLVDDVFVFRKIG